MNSSIMYSIMLLPGSVRSFLRDTALRDSAGVNNNGKHHLAILDTALLSLLGEEQVAVEELPARIDELLNLSFWHRRLERRNERVQTLFKAALAGRANVIWGQTSAAQRRGYFLAGVGLASGQELDRLAAELNPLLVEANASILEGHSDRAV